MLRRKRDLVSQDIGGWSYRVAEGLIRIPQATSTRERGRMTIVMGLDQHRAQITLERIDTTTGEVSRARVAPAHREPFARFLERFAGRALEVALEATTGWRFVVEELRRVGAEVYLAEPAETSARGERAPLGLRPRPCVDPHTLDRAGLRRDPTP